MRLLIAAALLPLVVLAEDAKPDAAALERGKAVYAKTCIACHQPTGKGLPGVFPPLDGSDWLEADPSLIARIVLRGIQGTVTINGTPFTGPMPMAPLAETLKDDEIADVVNYVRATYGKGGPLATPELVKAAREATKDQKQPFTAAELGRK